MDGVEQPVPESGYYVSSLRVRRTLLPVHEDGALVAYRCLTFPVDGPADGDKVMADQVEFEDELIRLNLKKKRDIVEGIFASAWRGLSLDKAFAHRPAGSEPTETLLRLINN
jgi:hypothetical protein